MRAVEWHRFTAISLAMTSLSAFSEVDIGHKPARMGFCSPLWAGQIAQIS